MKWLLVVILLAGCANVQVEQIGNVNIDEVKREYFTPEAYEAIKHIPIEEGLTVSGYAAGTSFWSKVWSFLSGHGVNRKVIVNLEWAKDGPTDTIIHEYIHHLDDMTRDGEGEWINTEEFLEGYKKCYGHQRYHGIMLYAETIPNQWFTDLFGIGEWSEHIAYIGSLITKQGCPEKLRWVYRKILKER